MFTKYASLLAYVGYLNDQLLSVRQEQLEPAAQYTVQLILWEDMSSCRSEPTTGYIFVKFISMDTQTARNQFQLLLLLYQVTEFLLLGLSEVRAFCHNIDGYPDGQKPVPTPAPVVPGKSYITLSEKNRQKKKKN